jgi:hypothetical protein
MRTITIYRNDSTAKVVIEHVKHFFWEAGNTILVIAQLDKPGQKAHHYIHWPREQISWFKDEPNASN